MSTLNKQNMKQFSLEEYLANPEKKVVTAKQQNVRIICTDRNTTYWKIIGLVTAPDGKTENPFTYDENGNESDGCLHNHDLDLFFADEEPELTEFELKVHEILYSDKPEYSTSDPESWKQASSELLALAKKEIEKDLPRWIRAYGDDVSYPHIGGTNCRYLIKDGYTIRIHDLEKLPSFKEDEK